MVAFGKLLIRKVAHPRGVLTRDKSQTRVIKSEPLRPRPGSAASAWKLDCLGLKGGARLKRP
jgi:hypothetical protein